MLYSIYYYSDSIEITMRNFDSTHGQEMEIGEVIALSEKNSYCPGN